MFGADVSEFMTLVKDHDLILLTEQGRADIFKKTVELGRRIPGKFIFPFLAGSIKKAEVSSHRLKM